MKYGQRAEERTGRQARHSLREGQRGDRRSNRGSTRRHVGIRVDRGRYRRQARASAAQALQCRAYGTASDDAPRGVPSASEDTPARSREERLPPPSQSRLLLQNLRTHRLTFSSLPVLQSPVTVTGITSVLPTAGQNIPRHPAILGLMSETTVTVSLDDRLVEVVDALARMSGKSRAEMAARIVAAGVAYKGFKIPEDVPC